MENRSAVRVLYGRLRDLEKAAQDNTPGYSRREVSKHLLKDGIKLGSQRLSDWVPRDPEAFKVPRDRAILWALVLHWSKLAGLPEPSRVEWDVMLESAQYPVGRAFSEEGTFDPEGQVGREQARASGEPRFTVELCGGVSHEAVDGGVGAASDLHPVFAALARRTDGIAYVGARVTSLGPALALSSVGIEYGYGEDGNPTYLFPPRRYKVPNDGREDVLVHADTIFWTFQEFLRRWQRLPHSVRPFARTETGELIEAPWQPIDALGRYVIAWRGIPLSE